MRVLQVAFKADSDADAGYTGFKGVNASFVWSSAVVLFGANDVGKSNILEALRTACAGGEPSDSIRRAFQEDSDEGLFPKTQFLIELDRLDDDASPDSRALAELIQASPPQIRMGSATPEAPTSNKLDVDGLSISFDRRRRRLSTLRRTLEKAIVAHAAATCRNWDVIAVEYGRLLNACLRSRWLLILAEFGDHVAVLLSPPVESLALAERNAAKALAEQRDLWPGSKVPILERAVSAITEEKTAIFLNLGDFRTFRPFDIVEFSESRPQALGLAVDIREEVEQVAAMLLDAAVIHCAAVGGRPLYTLRRSAPDEIVLEDRIWLEDDGEGWSRVHPLVQTLCRRIGQLATELCPAFIKSLYVIEVRSVPILDVPRRGPVEISLHSPSRARTFDLDVVGSGTAVWVGYAVAEALRLLSTATRFALAAAKTKDFPSLLQQALRDPPGEPTTRLFVANDSRQGLPLDDPRVAQHIGDATIRTELNSGTTTFTMKLGKLARRGAAIEVRQETLFIFDEPERHLHPAAQDQAATWIGNLVSRGAGVILASHAPPFLNLKTAPEQLGEGIISGTQLEDVQYLRVFRGSDGRTQTEPLSVVMAQHLDAQAAMLGLSRAQLVQVMRAVLVVEGAHDEKVIMHCYGRELRSDRILILPLRGATKAKFLAEAEFLRSLHLPMILLFDNTVDEESAENTELRQLYKYWPKETPPPQIVRFAARDIILALPDEHVRRALHGRWGLTFPGWQDLLNRLDESKQTNLKSFVLKSLKVPVGADDFLDEILRATPPAPLVGSELDRAIEEVRALARSTDLWFGSGQSGS